MTPKQLGFHMPAEWHPHAGCWMGWPCHQHTWRHIGLERARLAFASVAKAIAQFEPVTMIVNPQDAPLAAQLCGDDVRLLPLAINDSWLRDTGPTFVINQEGKLGGIDWIHNAWGGNYSDFALDNQIAAAVLHETQAQSFSAPLVMEGGSFHVDGEGTLITTRECLLNKNRNPNLNINQIENFLVDNLGVEKIIWLNKGLVDDETDGHVDEIACFIAPGKVLALITHDKSEDNYEILQENLEILKSSVDAKGRPLQIYTVLQPKTTYAFGERQVLSYINFYLANKGIVMASFDQPKYDQAAFELFSELFPHHKICQIPALDVFVGGGGIHCITQQQPDSSR
jgi:agmatine deiminase